MSFYAPLNKAVLRRPLEPELRAVVAVYQGSPGRLAGVDGHAQRGVDHRRSGPPIQ
jgi:hypothetical protein